MDEMFKIWPLRCLRITGNTACVILARPKTLISNMRRTCSSSLSSMAAKYPMPALLTSTSICPKRFTVFSTAAVISADTVTSSLIANAVSGYALMISFTSSVLRAATAALYPFANTSCASARPKPVEHPVISQTFFIIYFL